ncbi:MAG: aminoglycoside phosphotransferase family protein [Gammaproteobacteria bacterium]|nr:aminoglycoside phosphotransferase family protein [Gammaproteobacteria bacterium]
MDEPILKLHWERFKAHVDLDKDKIEKLLSPYCNDKIERFLLLSEGCANTNYKITFQNDHPPLVIRIYMREKSALKREVAIHRLVANTIPVPKHYYFDDSCQLYPYAYSILEWIDGRLMREIVLSKDENAINDILFEAGQYLDILRKIKFDKGGFFDEKLSVIPFTQEEKYLPYVLNLLQDTIVKDNLGHSLLTSVKKLVELNLHLLPDLDDANLTHSDYDPANIIVKEINGRWKIAAILDWEFSYSGTYLLDMGLMLRYSHKLPKYYEEEFIEGIESNGHQLPTTWKKQAKLMDLLCLLQLTHSNQYSERPNLNRDVVSLITHTVNQWNTF